MNTYEQFDATHRILAHDDDQVAVCKSDLISALEADATEFRVGIHATERDSLPKDVASLDRLAESSTDVSDDEMTWRFGKLPDDASALQSLHDAIGDDGSLPVSTLTLHGETFDGLVTNSTSHSHVGALNVRDSSSRADPSRDDFVGSLTDALENHGLVLPVGVIAAWERDDKYVELTGPELCVYATPVEELSEEERLSVSHHCHDLTALRSVTADSDTREIRLSWESSDSLAARATRRVFGGPPEQLVVPREAFSEVASHLSRFIE